MLNLVCLKDVETNDILTFRDDVLGLVVRAHITHSSLLRTKTTDSSQPACAIHQTARRSYTVVYNVIQTTRNDV